MMLSPPEVGLQTLREIGFGYTKRWAVGLILPEHLALLSTVFRLIHRYRKGLLWWDDTFAFVALVTALPLFGTTYIMLIDPPLSPALWPIITWIIFTMFKTSEWSCRVSWCLSVARIIPPYNPIFRTLIGIAWVLVALWAGSILSMILMCTQQRPWQNVPPYMCPATTAGVAFPFAAAIGADLSLALIPLRLFWRINLPQIPKRAVLLGFTAGSMVVPAAILGIVACVLPRGPFMPGGVMDEYLVMHVGLICCIFSCNALVLVTSAFRVWYRHNPEVQSQLSRLSTSPTWEISTRSFASFDTSNSPPQTDGTTPGLRHLQTGSSALTRLSEHFSEYTSEHSNLPNQSSYGSQVAEVSVMRKREVFS